jgi:hypothetical protein
VHVGDAAGGVGAVDDVARLLIMLMVLGCMPADDSNGDGDADLSSCIFLVPERKQGTFIYFLSSCTSSKGFFLFLHIQSPPFLGPG